MERMTGSKTRQRIVLGKVAAVCSRAQSGAAVCSPIFEVGNIAKNRCYGSAMAIKFKAKSKEEIPAELQAFYLERDGAFVLDVEGAVDKSRVEEVRSSNVALMSQLAEQKKRFEAIESEQVKSIAAERDSLNAKLTAIQVDQGVLTVATKKGLRPTAVPDITARARVVFKLVDGAPRAYEGDGQTVRVGRDGVTPMSLDEWVDQQVADAPHLFEANSGSGASSTGQYASGVGSGGKGTKNPFKRESWNLTEQMRLQKTDPGLAARLKAAS